MHGLQGLGDHHVSVNGDGQQVDHGGDAKEGATEGIHLTAYQNKPQNEEGATAGYRRVKGITRLSKRPLLVERVDEEDRRLRGRHEEVADCQVHDEVVGQAA